jgi:hypothetical protein
MKRQVLAIALLAIGVPAIAQKAISPTPAMRAWIVLLEITYGSDDEAAQSLRYRGFSEEGIARLIAHVRAGTGELNRLATQATADLCARGAQYEGNPEMLAQEFERQEAAYEAAVTNLVHDARTLLNDGDRMALETVVADKGSHMGSVETDVPGAVRRGVLSPAETVNNACRAIASD